MLQKERKKERRKERKKKERLKMVGHTPAILALGRLRQEDYEIEDNLHRLRNPVLIKPNKQKLNQNPQTWMGKGRRRGRRKGRGRGRGTERDPGY